MLRWIGDDCAVLRAGGVAAVSVDVMADAIGDLRIFAGYAGWGAGQLSGELEEGSWYVVDALSRDVFGPDASRLRQEVLRSQPGELAWLSTRPENPSQN